MIPLEAAVLDIVGFLEAEHVPHMVIGGFANLHWGRPRLTQAIDVKIALPEDRWSAFTREVGKHFRILVEDPRGMLEATHVLPLRTRGGIPVDLVVAVVPYEERAIERAIPIAVGGGSVRICTAEDLVLHKVLSDRPRDREDVEGILVRQGARLDRGYLDPRVQEVARGLERPDILEFFRSALAKAGLREA